jgi:hypothetical protein
MPVLPLGGPDGAASFHRIGEVRARRLTAGTTWRNLAGDEFTGVAGDWLIVDDDGHERTVRDSEFQASHVLVAGDRWRRTGRVLAWQVTESTSVRTLEGRATAQPGEWIIQGPRGERWPVREEHFARGYLSEGSSNRLNFDDANAAASVAP